MIFVNYVKYTNNIFSFEIVVLYETRYEQYNYFIDPYQSFLNNNVCEYYLKNQ